MVLYDCHSDAVRIAARFWTLLLQQTTHNYVLICTQNCTQFASGYVFSPHDLFEMMLPVKVYAQAFEQREDRICGSDCFEILLS